ncbi:MAG: M28 family peptidase [Planctomycetota bacterium]|jgi:hypothetical protein
MQKLSGSHLFGHIQRFAGDIGPRPAGHAAETKARDALQAYLHRLEVTQTEQLSFSTTDTWGYGTITPLLIALVSSLLPVQNRFLKATLNLMAAHQFWLTVNGQMRSHPLYRFYPQYRGGTLLARISPKQDIRQKVVLVGHTDTNKHRLSFSPKLKHSLRLSSTSLFVAILANALATFANIPRLRQLLTAYIGLGTLIMLADEAGPYVEGANDNGSAVACVLGLGEQALLTPLEYTELWLAFTGSEEISHDGLNALLDKYGDELQDAYFIDFEMVGKGDIHYVQKHLGLMYFTDYCADAESLRIAAKVAARHPELSVTGRDVFILEEVATLHRRGFKGICLVGLEADGFGANWHRRTDTTQNINPDSLERAAKFAWTMIRHIDQQD